MMRFSGVRNCRKGDAAMYQRCLRVLSALLFVGAVIPALSQVVPAAQEVRLPLRVGAGYSNYGSDWNRRLGGPAVWIDFDVPKLPPSWSGFQLEVEGRDLNYNRTGTDSTLRQYTFAGGVNYAWRYDPAFHPYVKFLAGIGNINFNIGDPYYRKDSRTLYAPGGGVDVRAHGRLWIRGDYEYQFWTDFFNHHALTPHGFTIGVFYDFSKFALSQYHP
jgi:opacity protein-like surface antigen